jgi:hypothetical protein
MVTLLILAVIGAVAGSMGGALTNGLDGLILGGCAGFVLGVIAWITNNIEAPRVQELHPDQLLNELNGSVSPTYDHLATLYQRNNERTRSP